MSLSRSEEMHRLTENVYKVSPQRGGGDHGGLPGRVWGGRALWDTGWRAASVQQVWCCGPEPQS